MVPVLSQYPFPVIDGIVEPAKGKGHAALDLQVRAVIDEIPRAQIYGIFGKDRADLFGALDVFQDLIHGGVRILHHLAPPGAGSIKGPAERIVVRRKRGIDQELAHLLCRILDLGHRLGELVRLLRILFIRCRDQGTRPGPAAIQLSDNLVKVRVGYGAF